MDSHTGITMNRFHTRNVKAATLYCGMIIVSREIS